MRDSLSIDLLSILQELKSEPAQETPSPGLHLLCYSTLHLKTAAASHLHTALASKVYSDKVLNSTSGTLADRKENQTILEELSCKYQYSSICN